MTKTSPVRTPPAPGVGDVSPAPRQIGDSRRQRAAQRREDLRRVEQAITRISRIGSGKDAAMLRSRRSGAKFSRPGIAIIATLARCGELRVGDIARQTDLETPLISRELNRLVADGFALRRADVADGRVALVSLSEQGVAAFRAYREATDDIIAETFTDWSSQELHELATTLEHVVRDFSHPGGAT